MTTPTITRERVQQLAEKIQLALPKAIVPDLVFSVTQDKKNIRIDKNGDADFSGNDIRIITDILKQSFQGDYISAPGAAYYWAVPIKPVFQDVPIPPHAIANQNVETPAPATPQPQPEPEKPAPGPQEKAPEPEKVPETPSQPSPITQFLGNMCETCEDRFRGCNPRTEDGKRKMDVCFEVLKIGLFRNISLELSGVRKTVEKINVSLEIIAKDAALSIKWKHDQEEKTASAPTKTPEPARSSTPAPAPQPAPAPKPNRTVDGVKSLITADILDHVTLEQKGDYIIVKPKHFLGNDVFAKLGGCLRDVDGEYISAGKESHFRVPVRSR